MAKADRLERLDIRRAQVEAEYLEALVLALQKAAAGSWGLFGHNPDRHAVAKWAPVVKELCDLGQEVDEIRSDLGMEPFPLHEEFENSRGPVPPTAPGEPKQARKWLNRLGKSA
jgi:hypothetical protein